MSKTKNWMVALAVLLGSAATCATAETAKYPARGDAAAISKMIAAAKAAGRREVVVPKKNPRSGDELWIIEETIRIPSGTRLILDGAQLVLADDAFCNVFQNEHAWATNRCTRTAEDRDIEIVGRNGAKLDGGNYNGWGERSIPGRRGMAYWNDDHKQALAKVGKSIGDNSFIYFHNVSGFRVSGLFLRHQRYWSCCFNFCDHGVIRDLHIEADISWVSLDGSDHRPNRIPGLGDNLYVKNGDGIDLRKGCHDILVENISGWSEDDLLAMTNLSGEAVDIVETKSPDIHHITARNLRGTTFLWFNHVRLLCADGWRIHDIDIDGVYEECDPRIPWRGNLSAIQLNDWTKEYYRKRPAAMGELRDVKIRNVVSAAPQPIHLFGAIENVEIEGVHLMQGAHCVADVMTDATFRNVTISKVTADESVKLCSLFCFLDAEGEITLKDVKVGEAEHFIRSRGAVKANFENVAVGKLTGEKRVVSDKNHATCPELPEYLDVPVGL